jgi:transcriptional regulator with XRE-family HTH domain
MLKSLHTHQNAIFVDLLREFRCRARLRQADLAQRLGKGQGTVSKVERGVRRLDIIELKQWLAAIDVDLLTFTGELLVRLRSEAVSVRIQAPRRAASTVALMARADRPVVATRDIEA